MPVARKKRGRPCVRIQEPSASEVLRLLQEAYRLIGEPGAEALSKAAGVGTATAWRLLQGNPSPQLIAVQRCFAAMGFELRLAKVRRSKVPSSESGA